MDHFLGLGRRWHYLALGMAVFAVILGAVGASAGLSWAEDPEVAGGFALAAAIVTGITAALNPADKSSRAYTIALAYERAMDYATDVLETRLPEIPVEEAKRELNEVKARFEAARDAALATHK